LCGSLRLHSGGDEQLGLGDVSLDDLSLLLLLLLPLLDLEGREIEAFDVYAWA
jgi:hypothetical protein